MVLFATTLLLTGSGWAEPFQAPPVSMEVVADQLATAPGTTIQVLAVLDIPRGWHIYWQNPGDSGQATQITLQSNQTINVSAPHWTAPEETLVLDGGVVNYAYTHQAGALFEVQISEQVQNLVQLDLAADYLICKHACVPGQVRGQLALPISTHPHAGPHGAQVAHWAERLPKPLPANSLSTWQQSEVTIQIPKAIKGRLFPSEELEACIESIAWGTSGEHMELTLKLTAAPKDSLTGSVLRISETDGHWVDYELTVDPPESP